MDVGILLFREKELLHMLGVSRTTLRAWEQTEQFPRRIKLGPKAVAWRKADIDAWLATRQSRGDRQVTADA